MGKKKFSDYYLGLDIGTNSVGWAATDENYNLLRLNGKDFWGIRLFEEAKTAEERRTFRSSRRRNKRKVRRLNLLESLFYDEVVKVDPIFFDRLKNSKYHFEDKSIKSKYTLFDDKNYTDKDFYKEYPTIYHLNKALILDEAKPDIRLLYISLHHMLKKRGHFLFEGQNISNTDSFKESYDNLARDFEDILNTSENDLNTSIDLDENEKKELETIIQKRDIPKSDKQRRVFNLFNTKDKQIKELTKLLCGLKCNLSVMFSDKTLEETEFKIISFSDANYEENIDNIANILLDKFSIIEKAKMIYDWSLLASMKQGEKYLSFAKVNDFEQHKKDLALLKKMVKKYIPGKYNSFFRDSKEKNNYCAYTLHNDKNLEDLKLCTQEDFIKFVKSAFEKYLKDSNVTISDLADSELDELYKKLNNGTFMPKQRTKDNSVIPYQLIKSELDIILSNYSKYFSFLNNKDEKGLTVIDKVKSIFTFRIPYYVGPLNPNSKFSWVERKKLGEVLPWNYKEMIDENKSAENFIKRMTNKCTYLHDEDVLPKNSILYSRFMVLNELNNLKINDEKVSVSLKQGIFNDLFLTNKKVTNKKLEKYLLENNYISKGDVISGIDGDFKSNMSSYIALKNIIGATKIKDVEMAENIILWNTLFNDAKGILKNKIIEGYSNCLSSSEIEKLCKLNFKGWGRLSKELLDGEHIIDINKETGEVLNIITMMWRTNNNLMQLLSYEYNYTKCINDYNENNNDNKTLDERIDEMYVSPSVKRSIKQSVRIVNEIKKITNKQPKKIFVEMTRNEGEKKRTKSRKDQLIDLYKNIKKEERDWIEEISNKKDYEFRRTKLYLYYTQMGRCMYTGETIDINELFDTTIYDRDHIYPQSKIKDDSLDNLVLVKKNINGRKSDNYPIDSDIRKKMHDYWKFLRTKNLISERKYNRLTRTTELTDEELASFVARQIVTTSQSNKAVAELLKELYDNSEIVYVKAGNVSSFRNDNDFIKVREVNDYHHAKDAYLNIVVGNVYNTKYSHNPLAFIKKNPKYNLSKTFNSDVNGAWKVGNKGTIKTVTSVMNSNNILYTEMLKEQKGGFFDQKLMKKGKGQYPIKSGDSKLSDINNYGGYNKVTISYLMLVEGESKGELVRTLEPVPLIYKDLMTDDDFKNEYLINQTKLKSPRIIKYKIPYNSLININGFHTRITGKTNECYVLKSSVQLILKEDLYSYTKKIYKCLNKIKTIKDYDVNEYDGVSKNNNLYLYEEIINKLMYSKYSNMEQLNKKGKFLLEKKDDFINLTMENQVLLLSEILKLTSCDRMISNLQLVNGGKNVGTLTINKNISNYNQFELIHQSITGIFSSKENLLE